jgi:hypothetical protein
VKGSVVTLSEAYCADIGLEELTKTMKTLDQVSRTAGRDWDKESSTVTFGYLLACRYTEHC